MTLQLALDGAEKGRTLDEAMGLARAARQYTDIIEVGTSFVPRDGLAAVKKFARAGFGVPILADVKIMDCGAGLCAMACEAGADIVTVMAFAADKTIEGVVREAHTRGRRVMADLLGMQNAAAAAQRVHALGADIVCLHVAVDAQQGKGGPAVAQVAAVSAACGGMPLAVAGGIREDTARALCASGAEWLIVGGAVCNAPDARTAAAGIRAAMEGKGL